MSDADRWALADMMEAPRKVAAYRDIVNVGERAGGLRLIHRGFACRYIDVSNGQRQITELLLPGDIFTTYAPFVTRSDCNVASLTPVVYSEVPRLQTLKILENYPHIALAVWRANIINEATLHERVANLGRRSAKERLAHLLCELFVRTESVGLANGMQCSIPLSQSDLADVLGISIVHTNRSLQALRTEELVRFERGLLTVLDFDRLRDVASFCATYLQIETKAESATFPLMAAMMSVRQHGCA